MAGVKSESAYISAILDRRGPVYEKLKRKYPRLLEYIEERIRNYECPFCRRGFKAKFALFKHLLHSSPCSKLLLLLVERLRENADEEELLRVLEV